MRTNTEPRKTSRLRMLAIGLVLMTSAASTLLPLAQADHYEIRGFTLRGVRVDSVIADEEFLGPVDVLLHHPPPGCRFEPPVWSWERTSRTLDRPLPQGLPGDDAEPVVVQRPLLASALTTDGPALPGGTVVTDDGAAAWTVVVPNGRHYIITVIVVVVCHDGTVLIYAAVWYQRN